jgi:hypothetical protein
MGEAQKRFNEATNQVDRAYWQGALDGERAEHERIIDTLEDAKKYLDFYNPSTDLLSCEFDRLIDIIKGEN